MQTFYSASKINHKRYLLPVWFMFCERNIIVGMKYRVRRAKIERISFPIRVAVIYMLDKLSRFAKTPYFIYDWIHEKGLNKEYVSLRQINYTL